MSALSYKEKDKKTGSEDGEDTVWPEKGVVGEGPFQLHLEEGRNMEFVLMRMVGRRRVGHSDQLYNITEVWAWRRVYNSLSRRTYVCNR